MSEKRDIAIKLLAYEALEEMQRDGLTAAQATAFIFERLEAEVRKEAKRLERESNAMRELVR